VVAVVSVHRRRDAVAVVLLTAAKELHEYALHGGRWLDSFTARDVVDWTLGPFTSVPGEDGVDAPILVEFGQVVREELTNEVRTVL
jgi:hypothetical protein